jgi:hypothetical protein
MELHEKRFAFGFALTAAGLLMSGAARAEPAPSQPKASYGWQILVVDLADAVLAAGGVAMGSNYWKAQGSGFPLEMTASGFYVAGGPVVHLAHEHAGRAAVSFGLRVGAPLVLGLAGWLIAAALYHPGATGPDQIEVAYQGFGVGAGVGVLSASAIDIAALAREPASSESAKPSGHSAQLWPSLVVLPSATTVRDAGHRLEPMFGIAGTF